MKYFTYEYEKLVISVNCICYLRDRKRIFDVPGRSVISYCGTPPGKASGFLDHHLQPIV